MADRAGRHARRRLTAGAGAATAPLAVPDAAFASHRLTDSWLGVFYLVLLAGVALGFWLWRREQRGRRRLRQDQVTEAARVAEGDDAAFAAAAVLDRARALVGGVTGAWERRDPAGMEPFVTPGLLERWTPQIQHGAGPYEDLRFTKPAELHYVGLTNRVQDAEDRVTVHVSREADRVRRAPTPIRIGSGTERTRATVLDEYWTLAKHDGRWRVHAVETEREGARHLDVGLAVTPDRAPRPRADMTPVGAEATTFDLPAWDAMERLSAGDQRFAPDRLAAAVRDTADAWMRAAADPPQGDVPADVAATLTDRDHVDAGARLVVRWPQVRGIRIVEVDEDRSPPRVAVRLGVRGLRWAQDRVTDAVVAGDREREVGFTERWTFVATDDPDRPWRLEHVYAPVDV